MWLFYSSFKFNRSQSEFIFSKLVLMHPLCQGRLHWPRLWVRYRGEFFDTLPLPTSMYNQMHSPGDSTPNAVLHPQTSCHRLPLCSPKWPSRVHSSSHSLEKGLFKISIWPDHLLLQASQWLPICHARVLQLGTYGALGGTLVGWEEGKGDTILSGIYILTSNREILLCVCFLRRGSYT